ncbi:hypothetical protein D3C87_1431380 [compost metagenome]
MKDPLAGPLSLPSVPAVMVATEASLSTIVVVAVLLAMVTKPPVTLLMLALNVSPVSTILSSLIGTVNVKLVLAAAPAGKVKIPLVAV